MTDTETKIRAIVNRIENGWLRDKRAESEILALLQQSNREYGNWLIGEGEIQFLRKDKLEYQLGWCEGREQLRAELRKKNTENKKP